MKKLVLFMILSLCSVAWAAKVAVPTLRPVQKAKAPGAVSAIGQVGGSSGAGAESLPIHPLDEPFTPKYTFKGVSRNIIPIGTYVYIPKNDNYKYSGCSALRFHKYWIVTAAHCLDDIGNTDRRVSVSIAEHEKGLFQVILSPVEKGEPSNAEIYFIKQGYRQDSYQSSYINDIALIRLDKKDAVLDYIEKDLKSQKNNKLILSDQKETLAKLRKMKKIRQDFIDQPLDDYRFYITDSTYGLVGRTATVFRFPGQEGSQRRFSPTKHEAKFMGQYKGETAHPNMLFWNINTNKELSGSPVIINGFSVSNTSGPAEGGRATPMYTDRFQSFLKKSMGSDYTLGLCVKAETGDPIAVPDRKIMKQIGEAINKK